MSHDRSIFIPERHSKKYASLNRLPQYRIIKRTEFRFHDEPLWCIILHHIYEVHLKAYETESEIIRLADYDIKPGVYTHVDSDDWSEIFEKILGADIILFVSPVWGGVQSSLNAKGNRAAGRVK